MLIYISLTALALFLFMLTSWYIYVIPRTYRPVIVSISYAFLAFTISFSTIDFFYCEWGNESLSENVAPNVNCQVLNNGNYSGACSIARGKTYSFTKYLLNGGYSDKNDIGFPNYNDEGKDLSNGKYVFTNIPMPVLVNKKDGTLYLKVYAKSFKGTLKDTKNIFDDNYRGEYVKFSDLPKLFNASDINALADSTITDDDKRFNQVDEFDARTKAPILKKSD